MPIDDTTGFDTTPQWLARRQGWGPRGYWVAWGLLTLSVSTIIACIQAL